MEVVRILEQQGHLGKMQTEVAKVLEKVESRERYINAQLDNLVREYRAAQDGLAAISTKYA
jgi:estrogen-related receptor beta like 1